MITYIRQYDDGSIRHSTGLKGFLDWGNALDCNDFVIDLDQRTVTLVEPPKQGWLGKAYFKNDKQVAAYMESWSKPGFYCTAFMIGDNANKFFAETEDEIKRLIERFAQ